MLVIVLFVGFCANVEIFCHGRNQKQRKLQRHLVVIPNIALRWFPQAVPWSCALSGSGLTRWGLESAEAKS